MVMKIFLFSMFDRFCRHNSGFAGQLICCHIKQFGDVLEHLQRTEKSTGAKKNLLDHHIYTTFAN
jgi:hypothetical protein